MKFTVLFCLFSVSVGLVGCAGMKVINPNDQNPNEGTLALDAKDGQLKVVKTFSCKLESMGKRHWAMGKTEDEARNEVLAKCRDNTLISVCEPEKIKCVKN